MNLIYNKEEFYRAHLARDPRFDGKFFVAVKTTMIYCRPICPARNIEQSKTIACAIRDRNIVVAVKDSGAASWNGRESLLRLSSL